MCMLIISLIYGFIVLTCIVYFVHTSECKRDAEVKDISTKFRPQALNQKVTSDYCLSFLVAQ